MAPNSPFPLSAAQAAFLDAADRLCATSPDGARPLAELPRLSARELDALMDRGLVREAAQRAYYTYTPRPDYVDALPAGSYGRIRSIVWNGRAFKALAFWLVALLIPIVLMMIMR